MGALTTVLSGEEVRRPTHFANTRSAKALARTGPARGQRSTAQSNSPVASPSNDGRNAMNRCGEGFGLIRDFIPDQPERSEQKKR